VTRLAAVWAWGLRQFEHGDLVPLIILISAVHYAAILRGHDALPVAIAIGLLVDLGHYRWVRAAVRYKGASSRERAARWAMAAGMTALAVAYQQRYYGDWTLSLPLPALVLSLAWLAEADKVQGIRKAAEPAPQAVCSDTQPAPQVRTDAKPANLLPAIPAEPAPPACEACGYPYAPGKSLPHQRAQHAKHCPAKRRNGHKIEMEKEPTRYGA